MIVAVLLTVLIGWLCGAVLVAVVFAAIGKAGLREEAARDRAPVMPDAPTPEQLRGSYGPAAERIPPLVAGDAW